MGNVVALSAYESKRGSERKDRQMTGAGEVVLFTGVRYERIGKREEGICYKSEASIAGRFRPIKSQS